MDREDAAAFEAEAQEIHQHIAEGADVSVAEHIERIGRGL